MALALAVALGDYWWLGRPSDGEPWLRAALERAADASSEQRADALVCRARLAGTRRSAESREHLASALELYRHVGHRAGVATCLAQMAALEAFAAEYGRATALATDAVAALKGVGDLRVIAHVHKETALAANGYAETAARALPALDSLRAVGDELHLAFVCSVTGYLALAEGRGEEALNWLRQALDGARSIRDPRLLYLILGNIGLARLFAGDLRAAREALDESVSLCRAAGMEDTVDETLLALAAVAAREGDGRRAALLAGAGERHSTASRAPGEDVILSRLRQEFLAPAHDANAEQWDRLAEEGAELTVEQAIDLAHHGALRQTGAEAVR
jgi:hypothetical protein